MLAATSPEVATPTAEPATSPRAISGRDTARSRRLRVAR
jgi:hypothetical protein